MFDIAPSELLLVAVVALVVIGPKDLPKALRILGYWVGRARGVARQFRAGFDEMVREAELAEMEKKWASENERIMREHGGGAEAATETPVTEPAKDGEAPAAAVAATAEATAAPDHVAPAADEQLPPHSEPAPSSPEQLTLLPPPPETTPRPERVTGTAALARMRESRPGPSGVGVPVEHPQLAAAPPDAAPPPPDPAAS